MSNPIQRPFKPADLQSEPCRVFQLTELAAAERETSSYASAGRTGTTLMKSSGLTLLLIVIRKGAEIRDHEVRGAATIMVQEGRVRFIIADSEEPRELSSRDSLVLVPGLRHRVEALEDSAFLIAIGADAAE